MPLVRCIRLLKSGQKLRFTREVPVDTVRRYYKALTPEQEQYQSEIGRDPRYFSPFASGLLRGAKAS